MTLAGSGVFAFALSGWLFISFTSTQFGQQTGFFDSALKAAHCAFKGFVFAEFDNHFGSLLCCIARADNGRAFLLSSPII
jgi:hypothetical protein